MYRIGLNTAMATFRKPRVVLTGSNGVPEHIAMQNPVPEESREELVFNAVKKLDDAERAIIALYLEDITYAEMAEILGISESNVGVRLNRIKKKIRLLLNA
jgi:RNA polymerase sigma-70 factor (ECF subfamily)